MIRIGIDAHGVGGHSLGCGNETYFAQLIAALSRIDSENEYHVFANDVDAFDAITSRSANFRVVRLRARSQWLQRPVFLPAYVRKHKLDVVHCPFVPPPFVNAVRVITVHDLGFELHPEWYTLREVMRMKLLVRRGCRVADRIFTVSHFAASHLQKLYGVPQEKIAVTYNAVGPAPLAADYGDAFRIPGGAPYLLYLGLIQPRKNLARLVRAFNLLVEEDQIPHHLVIAGQRGWNTGEFDEAVSQSPWRNRIHQLGFVPPQLVAQLLRNAAVFVFPSLFEGFGIPPLESQRFGTPAVVSSSSCFPEVYGDSVQYCDPLSLTSIAAAIRLVIFDDALRARLVQRGFERIRRYSWENTARVALGAYTEAVQERGCAAGSRRASA